MRIKRLHTFACSCSPYIVAFVAALLFIFSSFDIFHRSLIVRKSLTPSIVMPARIVLPGEMGAPSFVSLPVHEAPEVSYEVQWELYYG
jgi:hypothetical protein